jgi:hypothetical protein
MQHDAHADCYGSGSKLLPVYAAALFQTCCLYVGYMKVLEAVCWPMQDASSNPLSSSVTDGWTTDRRTPQIAAVTRSPTGQSVTQTHAHRELIEIRTQFRVQFELQRVGGQRCSPRV